MTLIGVLKIVLITFKYFFMERKFIGVTTIPAARLTFVNVDKIQCVQEWDGETTIWFSETDRINVSQSVQEIMNLINQH